MRRADDVDVLPAALLVTLGVPLLSTAFGALMGSLLTATLTARASRRELEQADQHKILDRLHELELQEARRQGRDATTERNTDAQPS